MVDQLLLVLKIAFVVLLYLFIWRVIRVASRDMTVGQESMVLTPSRPLPAARERPTGMLTVTQSPELAVGTQLAISRPLLVGRVDEAEIRLPADGYASTRHARFVRGDQSDLVEDLGSTNGTFVNGEQLRGGRRLRDDDVITIGQTQLTYRSGG